VNKTSLIQSIQGSEGLRLTVYRCPANKLSIGYGRNLEDKGISKTEANLMLENDVLDINNILFDTFDFYKSLNDERQNVLIEMVYNLGWTGFLKFKGLIKALKNKILKLLQKKC
jgi:lysozyme